MNNYNKNMAMNKEAPASWCVLPWSHISIKPNGVYRLCCNSYISPSQGILRNKEKKTLHIRQASWEDVINSRMMKSIRKNMLKGKWSEECIRCQRETEIGMRPRNISERSTLALAVEPESYPNYSKAKKLTRPDGSISFKDFPISYMDIRFGNLCNLKCIMCGPGNSNKWYEDYQALSGNDYFWDHKEMIKLIPDTRGKLKTGKSIFDWSEDPHLWSQIEQHIQNFRKIYIVGGEPLLISSHYDFLQKCIDQEIAKKLIIEYNSNITQIPDKAWELWKHFKSINIGISIDGFGVVNDFIRYPSQWNQIEKNLKKLDTAEGNFNLRITATVSSLNIWHLPKFIEYIMSRNYKRIGSHTTRPLFHHYLVYSPKHLDINILEDHFKEEIKDYFDRYKKRISEFNWQSTYGTSNLQNWKEKINRASQIIDYCLKYMNKVKYNKEDLIKQRKMFIYFMDKLDELRNTQWSKILPELYESTLKWRTL